MKKKRKTILSILGYLFVLLYFFTYKNNNLTIKASQDYNLITTVYIFSGIIFIYTFIKYVTSIFVPYLLGVFIYFMMFIYYPLRDVNDNNLMLFSTQVVEIKKSTIIFFIGFLFYTIGYSFFKKKYLNHTIR